MGHKRIQPSPPWERISSLDALTLRIESRGLPMTVAALAILDAAPLVDPMAGVRLDAIRHGVAERLDAAPRLRQVLLQTRWWQGPPVWIDDPAFHIGRHVRACKVPTPGDETALLRLCCELNTPRLDPTHCPWELWVMTGLDDGAIGLLLRLHHVVADGASALNLLGVLFDSGPAAVRRRQGMQWGPVRGPRRAGPAPRPAELFRDSLRHRAAASPLALVRLARAARPSRLAARIAAVVAMARLLAGDGPAPALSFNRPVATKRQVALLRRDLRAARSAAHACGATVNDLVLAALAQGVRDLLRSRGELLPGLLLRVSVPTSLRHAGDGTPTGNRVGVRLLSVPLDGAGTRPHLADLARGTRRVKRRPPLQPRGRLLQRSMARVMSRQRLVNLLLSNVPGPASPLWFQGSRVRELFQIGALQGNVPISVGVLSYDGRLNIEIISDAGLVPDIEVLVSGFAEALDAMGA